MTSRLRPACDPPLKAGFVFLGSRLLANQRDHSAPGSTQSQFTRYAGTATTSAAPALPTPAVAPVRANGLDRREPLPQEAEPWLSIAEPKRSTGHPGPLRPRPKPPGDPLGLPCRQVRKLTLACLQGASPLVAFLAQLLGPLPLQRQDFLKGFQPRLCT